MGGYNSGNRSQVWRHDLVTRHHFIDVGLLKKEGMCPGRTLRVSWMDGDTLLAGIEVEVDATCLRLVYAAVDAHGAEQVIHETVPLSYTPCHFGGRRVWFCCPRCRQRTRRLYLVRARFWCRECGNLIYPSQREPWDDRLARKIRKLRARYGGGADLAKDFPDKPKGVHWRTYRRARLRDLDLNNALTFSICGALCRILGPQRSYQQVPEIAAAWYSRGKK